MTIKEIILYSYSGDVRRIKFKTTGLNIITGRSSTGKSALSDIVEYCMGRSTFNIPEGPIRDKVAWYGVIFQFPTEQVLIAKPSPSPSAGSCSRAMIRRGVSLKPPVYSEMEQNADDETVTSLLSDFLGIHTNRTDVAQEHSRDSFKTTIKHCFFYLFQKQGLIANKEQLFYRQNEPFMPQAIKDTLPILLGIEPENKLEVESKLRLAKRDLKIAKKQQAEVNRFSEKINERASQLLIEAQQVGLLASSFKTSTTEDALSVLAELLKWKPTQIPEEDTDLITKLEDKKSTLRRTKSSIKETLRAARLFSEREDGFTTEADEHKSRLQSIQALPQKPGTDEWQWPFAPKNLDLGSPIAEALIRELESLDFELKTVVGERPQILEYTQKMNDQLMALNDELKSTEEALAAAIAANSSIAEMGSRNAAAAKMIGRISLFLETYQPETSSAGLQDKIDDLKALVESLENETGSDDSAERLASILNLISTRIGYYVKELESEFSEFPFRFDFNKLSVVVDRPERPVPMNKTGGGANHLAYHLGALLSLHYFSFKNSKPIPSFLFLDQPTQVYFPSEEIYKAAAGAIEDTERDSDLEKVRKLFDLLYNFTTEQCPGCQIIVTEHANLRDQWFQDAIIEDPWTKPPALVPEDWESSI